MFEIALVRFSKQIWRVLILLINLEAPGDLARRYNTINTQSSIAVLSRVPNSVQLANCSCLHECFPLKDQNLAVAAPAPAGRKIRAFSICSDDTDLSAEIYEGPMVESVKLAPVSCVLAGKVPFLAGIVFARTDFGGSVRP